MKISEEYIRREYLRRFAQMTIDQQEGVIVALQTIRDARIPAPPEDRPLLREENKLE